VRIVSSTGLHLNEPGRDHHVKRLGIVAALVAALGLAGPASAGDRAENAKDTITEKKADAKKGLRDAKPGDKTAEDRVDDAKDSLDEAGAKTRKAGRKVKREVKEAVQ
jgi:hypothetical protein